MFKSIKISTLLVFAVILVSILGITEPASALSPIVPCSTEEPCPEGQECVDFPEVEPACINIQENYCDYYECPENTECLVAESYPLQIICSALTDAEDSENTAEEDINLDENIEAGDLGVKDPKILPGSRLYFLKNWGRNIHSFFTFNKVKKVELKSRYANEKLIELKKLSKLEKGPEVIKRAVESYKREMSDIESISKKIKEKASENSDVSKFLDKFTEHQILHHKILQKLEGQVPEQAFKKIKEAREEHLVKFGEVMNRLVKKENISKKLEESLERIGGSKFKDFKNLEILKELEERVPDEAKEAIREVRENSLIRLKERVENWSLEDQERFQDYTEKISGEKEKQLEILENLKSELREKSDIINRLDNARSRIIRKLPTEIRAVECPKITPPTIDFCKEGRIIPKRNEKGCLTNFECITPTDIIKPIIRERERECITLWDPVCGEDGKTYSNACFVKVAGIEIAYKGVCKRKLFPTSSIRSEDSVESIPTLNNE